MITILGHMIAGANTGGTVDLTLSALYTEMVLQLAVRYSEMFGLGWDMLSRVYYALPLAEYSLAWLPACLILYAVMITASRFHLSHQKTHDRELCV